MILYHGTLTRNVEAILRDGLRSRGNEPSHDAYLEHPSLPEFVYLTDHLGRAMSHAIRISERVHSGAPVSIIEVTVSDRSKLLYPDEDFLTDEWNSDMPDWPVSKQMEYMEYHRREWRKSLKHLRTVAYRGGSIRPVFRCGTTCSVSSSFTGESGSSGSRNSPTCVKASWWILAKESV
jgi:hypothetical protein